MTCTAVLGWARTPVVPVGGALAGYAPHALAAPVIAALLTRAGVRPGQVDAVIAGNVLGAGGNPARMAGLAAGLPDRAAAVSVDSQCCAGLDAVILGAGLIASGAAEMVVAGGIEAWSQAPVRAHRPGRAGDAPTPYDRPPFAPDPARDPDLLEAAAALAAERGISRAAQDRFAAASHARAVALQGAMRAEIVPFGGLGHDPYARLLPPGLLARMPVLAGDAATAVSRVAVAPSADGAAFVLLASATAAERLGLTPRLQWRAGRQAGGAPERPMLAVIPACAAVLAAANASVGDLWSFELHEAFAVQALAAVADLGIHPGRLGRGGGGLGRGHPIGASGAVALVRLLADMEREAPPGALGLTAVAAAGGLGSAALLRKL